MRIDSGTETLTDEATLARMLEDEENEEAEDDEDYEDGDETDADSETGALVLSQSDLADPENDFDSEEKARLMADAADAVRASDIAVLDLRGLTIIADFFLFATGKSSIQLRAIADRIEERLREQGYRKLRVEGYQEATWILLDYGDVVAHIMAEEQRAFYKIEDFWAAAPRLELDLNAEDSSLGGVPGMITANSLPD